MIWFDVAALVLLSAAFSTLQEARCAKLAEPPRPERIPPVFERTSQSGRRESHAA